jgi:hypothetical protein
MTLETVFAASSAFGNNMTIDRWLSLYIALTFCHTMEDFNNIFLLHVDLRNNETFENFKNEMMEYINTQLRHLRAATTTAQPILQQ